MSLTRKTMFSNNSYIVRIPSQLAKAYNIIAGDVQEFTLTKRKIRIRKAKKSQKQKGIK